jgi:hypothetical protein
LIGKPPQKGRSSPPPSPPPRARRVALLRCGDGKRRRGAAGARTEAVGGRHWISWSWPAPRAIMSSRGLVRLPVSSPSRRLLLHVRVCLSVSVSVAVDWIWSLSEGARTRRGKVLAFRSSKTRWERVGSRDVNGDPIPANPWGILLLGYGYETKIVPMGMDMGQNLYPLGKRVWVWEAII